MERTVPSTGSEEIELYLRTYYSLLRTTSEVQIRTLEEVHAGMGSLLHPDARSTAPDMSAFIYTLLRLPDCMDQVRLVVLGQSTGAFIRGGFGNVERWERVSAPARRRRCYFDKQGTLACFIASVSDIDDVIPQLTAFQMEWNKLHFLVRRLPTSFAPERIDLDDPDVMQQLADHLLMSADDLNRLRLIWDKAFAGRLSRIAETEVHFHVHLLSSSLSEYRRATDTWWRGLEESFESVTRRPLYFVLSNTHSFANLLAGFALEREDELRAFVESSGDVELHREWQDILAAQVPSSKENFLYYALKKYLEHPSGEALLQEIRAVERQLGIHRIASEHCFDIEAQVIELRNLQPDRMDPRLQISGSDRLGESDALILNIDYPLGLAAYNILVKVAERNGQMLGVYVLGKAATLNGVIGDVMIPDVVHDEHSRNTYLFNNVLSASDVEPYLVYGAVLDNQKAVSVRGTFLQTARYMDVFYREGYTDIEMEAGPFLSAVYEMYRPKRHPIDEIVNLYGVRFDLGIVHYASDTPLSKGKNLGAGSLSYYGMDPTYAASVAVLRRIFQKETDRILAGSPARPEQSGLKNSGRVAATGSKVDENPR